MPMHLSHNRIEPFFILMDKLCISYGLGSYASLYKTVEKLFFPKSSVEAVTDFREISL